VTEKASLVQARSKLRVELIQWRSYQFENYPQLHLNNRIPLIDDAEPEESHLKLPSSFPVDMRMKLGMVDLADVEFNLREGQAEDALEALRQGIKEFNHSLSIKKTNIFGQNASTQAQTYLRGLAQNKVSAADKYR
jgi:hypothetical protein